MSATATVQPVTPATLRRRLNHHKVELTGPARHAVRGVTSVVVHGGFGHWAFVLSDGTHEAGSGPATTRALTSLAVDAVARVIRDSGTQVSLLVRTLSHAPTLDDRVDLPHALELLPWAPDIERELASTADDLAEALITPQQRAQEAWERNPHRIPVIPGRDRIVVATDASRGRNRPGGPSWAWVSDDGFGDAACTTKVSSINAAELLAIARAVEATPADTHVHVISDSKAAVALVRNLGKGHSPETLAATFSIKERVAVEAALSAIRTLVLAGHLTIEWVRGHNGHRLNEAADRLALMARRLNDAGLGGETRGRVRAVLAEVRASRACQQDHAVLAA